MHRVRNGLVVWNLHSLSRHGTLPANSTCSPTWKLFNEHFFQESSEESILRRRRSRHSESLCPSHPRCPSPISVHIDCLLCRVYSQPSTCSLCITSSVKPTVITSIYGRYGSVRGCCLHPLLSRCLLLCAEIVFASAFSKHRSSLRE